MIHGFEHFIFELNDALYHFSGSKDLNYITEVDFLAIAFISIIAMYLYTVYIAFNPKYEKAISIFITTMSIVIAISIFTVEELYLFTLVIALIVGFYVAISSDKRYENIKDKIDRFF